MASERTELAPAELLKRLRSALANQPEDVPRGWHTANQWAEIWKMTPNAAGILLSRSVRIGTMESKKFRVITRNRGTFPTVHYREKQ
jgi:hypothetical protein